MCFFYLLLGHLFGDFVLQTDVIAENKVKSWQWNAIHAVIVTVSMVLMSIPFGLVVTALVLLNGVLHYFIDFYKPKAAQKIVLPGLIYFIIDQGVHIFAIYLISLFATTNFNMLLINKELLGVLIVLVFISSFSAVLSQYIFSIISPGVNKSFFDKKEKSIGNLSRILISFGLYFSITISPLFLIIIAINIFIQVFHFNKKTYSWMNTSHFAIKLTIDILISLIGFAFLLCF